MLIERCVSGVSGPMRISSFVFWIAKHISFGGCLSSVCSSVSPAALLSVSVLSSEPSASRLSLLHAPHVILRGCLPSTGTFLRDCLL